MFSEKGSKLNTISSSRSNGLGSFGRGSGGMRGGLGSSRGGLGYSRGAGRGSGGMFNLQSRTDSNHIGLGLRQYQNSKERQDKDKQKQEKSSSQPSRNDPSNSRRQQGKNYTTIAPPPANKNGQTNGYSNRGNRTNGYNNRGNNRTGGYDRRNTRGNTYQSSNNNRFDRNQDNRQSSYGRHANANQPPIQGTFNSIPQTTFQPLKYNKPHNYQNRIITEEIYGQELIPDLIYNYNLDFDEFRQLLTKHKSQVSNHQPKVIDNYYLYDKVLSIRDKGSVIYKEEVIKQNWKTDHMLKTLKISYQTESNHDLASQHKYHLIVRIIRFQAESHVFDIIVPRKTPEPFSVQSNLWIKLLSKQSMDFPEGTNFVHKKIIKIEKED